MDRIKYFDIGDDYIESNGLQYPRIIQETRYAYTMYTNDIVDFELGFVINIEYFETGDVDLYFNLLDDMIAMKITYKVIEHPLSKKLTYGEYAAKGFYFWKELSEDQSKTLQDVKNKYNKWKA